MQQYHIPQPLLLSFFSAPLYRDVARNWKGLCYPYLFLLLALSWIPSTIRVAQSISGTTRNEISAFTSQIPDIQINNGSVSVNVPEPHVITEPKTGDVIAIIDTTGQVTSLDDLGRGVLLTRNSLVVKKNALDTRVYSLSRIKAFRLTGQQVEQWVLAGMDVFKWVYFPVCLAGSFLYRVVQSLVYGVVGLLFASMLGTTLGYAASVRLAVIAVTPVIVLDTVLGLVPGVDGFWCMLWIVYLGIALGYLFFGVRAARGPGPAENSAGPYHPPTV